MKLSNVVATLSLTTMALFATFVFLLEGKREQFKREVEVRARSSQACLCSQQHASTQRVLADELEQSRRSSFWPK